MPKRTQTQVPDKYYGERIEFDPEFKGPIHRRSCTDLICLLLFVVFVAVWVAVGVFALKNGDVNRILVPTDSEGRKCGFDNGVEDKPYLVFFDLIKCLSPEVPIIGCTTPQVCVKSCPKETLLRWQISESTNIAELRDKVVCKVDPNTIKSTKQLLDHMDQRICAEHVFKGAPVSGRCLPFNLTEVSDLLPGLSVESLQSQLKLLTKIDQMSTMIVEDLVNFRWYIAASLLLVMIVCFIYIALMRWLAAPMVWFSILGIITILSYATYLSYERYAYLKANPVQLEPSQTNLAAMVKSLFLQKETWLAILILLCVLLVVILLAIIFLRKRIVIAIALIKEGSKAVSSVKTTLIFPVFPWILQCLILAVAITFILYLHTVGESNFKAVFPNNTDCSCGYKNGDNCVPQEFVKECSKCLDALCHFVGIQSPWYVTYMIILVVFGLFWLVFFVEGTGEMILASTFATWYWTFNKKNVPFFTLTRGLARTIRYHLGTVAFGSLIIAICRMIRVCLEYLDHKLKKYDNALTKAVMCCLKCFFKCLESFLRFINKNAYIMCAVHGKPFFSSAKDAFSLLMRNILRVFVLDKVTDFLFFLSKVVVSVGCGAAAYFAFKDVDNINYYLIPTLIVAVAAYFISSIFFAIYSMAVDTLFLCFLEDCERNDGSAEKPYFMSKELLKILDKRNKLN